MSPIMDDDADDGNYGSGNDGCFFILIVEFHFNPCHAELCQEI